ncbi:MAG: protein-export chaperone SecB [Alphaproteobacteria bacterium]|nr:protein-export chaperone SecB [Alphaproteobacteria bacterium]
MPEIKGQDFTILAQYVADSSFEMPNAPGIFADNPETGSDIDVGFSISANRLNDQGVRLVGMIIKITRKKNDKVIYILEIDYRALVSLGAAAGEREKEILFKRVPEQIFPFVRVFVMQMTAASGISPIVLQTIDFNAQDLSKV